jgi:hypothetical protein
MMSHRTLTRTLLLTCSLSLLSACDSMSETWANVTGERAQEQVVDGPRRAPMLNPKTEAPRAAAPMVMQVAAPASPPAAAPAADAAPSLFSLKDEAEAPEEGGVDYSAFDRFDDKGNEVVSKAEQPKLPTVEEGPRKAFPGNPSYSTHTEPTAPLPPAPLTPPAAPQAQLETPAAAPLPLLAQPEAPAAEAPAPTAPVATAEEAAPATGFLARVADSVSAPFAARSAEAASVTAQEKPAPQAAPDYPKLANVPPTPAAFEQLRAEKQEKITDLQTEHALAQDARQVLENEPSQLEAEPLESIAPAAAATPLDAAPVAADAPAVIQAQVQQDAAEAQPVLLGQATAPVEAVPAAAPQAAVEASAEPVAEASAEKPQGNAVSRWFKSLPPLFGAVKAQPPAASAEDASTTPTAPAPALAEPAATAPQSQPVPLNDGAAVLRSASGEELPSLRPQPAPVAPVVAQDAPLTDAPTPLLQVTPAAPQPATPVDEASDDELNVLVAPDDAMMQPAPASAPASALPSPQLLRAAPRPQSANP